MTRPLIYQKKVFREVALGVLSHLVGGFSGNLGTQLVEALLRETRIGNEIDIRVEEAIASLKKTSETIESLERVVQERATRLGKLREDHERFTQLAKMSEEQANALLLQLRQTIGLEAKRERVVALFINLIAGLIVFVLGVILSHPITRWLGGIFR